MITVGGTDTILDSVSRQLSALTVVAQKMMSTNGGIGFRYALALVDPEDGEKEPTGWQQKDPFNGPECCLMKLSIKYQVEYKVDEHGNPSLMNDHDNTAALQKSYKKYKN